MKKLFLAVFVLLSLTTVGQEAETSILLNEHKNLAVSDVTGLRASKITLGSKSKTRGPDRWYDIVDAVYQSFAGAINVYANDSYNTLWEDSTILAPYGSPITYSGVWVKSVASYIDPVDPRYNDENAYPGEIAITNIHPFTIDSLFLPFLYYRNPAKTNVVDTLIVSVIYGNGSGNGNDLDIRYYGPTTQTAQNHSTDTLRVLHGFTDLNPASSGYNGYLASSPSRVRTTKIPLTTATLVDTQSNGFNYVQIPINLNVPAGYKAAASMTFKSGDTWTPNVDTLYVSGNREKPNFNHARFVAFEEIDGGHQLYTKGVWTQSALMRTDTSWGNRHIPSFAFSNTSYEHQWFQWKLSCPTCWLTNTDNFMSVVKSLSIYPNPTNDNTTISFSTKEPLHNTQIQLLNINGSIVSRNDIGFIERNSTIEREISTWDIADGMYFIRLKADEGLWTEKLIIQ